MISKVINARFERNSRQNTLLKEVIRLLAFLRSIGVDDVASEKIIRLRSGWVGEKFVSPEFSKGEQKYISTYYNALKEVEI